METLLTKYPDPVLHRCFGAALTGPGLVSDGDLSVKSTAQVRSFRVDLTALTTTKTVSLEAWQTQLSRRTLPNGVQVEASVGTFLGIESTSAVSG